MAARVNHQSVPPAKRTISTNGHHHKQPRSHTVSMSLTNYRVRSSHSLRALPSSRRERTMAVAAVRRAYNIASCATLAAAYLPAVVLWQYRAVRRQPGKQEQQQVLPTQHLVASLLVIAWCLRLMYRPTRMRLRTLATLDLRLAITSR